MNDIKQLHAHEREEDDEGRLDAEQVRTERREREAMQMTNDQPLMRSNPERGKRDKK
jgi:hypothetical protein